jgi:hypothetical protein
VHVEIEQLAALSPDRHDDADTQQRPPAGGFGVGPAGGLAAARDAVCCDSAPRPGGAVAELDWGGPILRQCLERIGCTAQIVRLVTAGGSRTLDAGAA